MTSGTPALPVDLCPLDELRRTLAGLAGRPVTLMGLGAFNGGVGAARFLAEQGALVTVTDLHPAEKLARSLEELRDLPLIYHLGGHVPEDFTAAGLVVASTGVPRTNKFLHMARQAGVPVTSDMNMFLALCPARIAAVTGSNGKSTTTAMLARMLECAGHQVWLGGNIGISLLPALSRIRAGDLVVLEVSSFQLEDAAALHWSPHVAVVTNITPNHLDRHPTFDDYANAKRQLLLDQTPEDFVILNASDTLLRRWAAAGPAARLLFFDADAWPGALANGMNLVGERLIWHEDRYDEVVCLSSDVPLPGRHNVENALAAAAAARCFGAGSGAVREGLHTFTGLDYRLQFVGEFSGVRYYNDSSSTTPESTVAALESFEGPLTLIAGGSDKRLDLTPIAQAVARCAEVVIVMGQTGPGLAQRARQESICEGRSVLVREAKDLPEAVRLAGRLSMPGSAVLFSPGCASFDMFTNCKHRGEMFRQLVVDNFGNTGCENMSA